MRKNVLKMTRVAMLLFAMNSCGDKTTTGTDVPLVLSPLTVEAQKSAIEKDGLDLADKMKGLNEAPAIKTILFLDGGQLNAPVLVAPLRQLSANLLRNDAKAIETYSNQMRAAAVPDSVWGTYTWNKNTQKYDHVKGSIGQATISFPADSLSYVNNINNGKLTIAYTVSNVAVPKVTPVEFLPKSFSVILTIGGTKALDAEFTGDYKTDGTPKLLKQTLEIGAYNWSEIVTNNDKDVSEEFIFKYNTQTLLKYAAGLSGSLTATQIQASINDSTERPQDLITAVYMSLQVMNVAVYGGITDVKTFYLEMHDREGFGDNYSNYNGYGSNNRGLADKDTQVYNKYLNLYAYFTADNKKFAKVEFYAADKIVPDYSWNKPGVLVYTQLPNGTPIPNTIKYDYMDWTNENYNYNTGMYQYTKLYYLYPTKITYNSQPRLVLSDDSKVTDFEKFGNDYFGAALAKFKTMLPQ